MYHRRDGLKREIFRAKRDVTITYLPVVGERKFNYIDFRKIGDIFKIFYWVIYVNLIFPSLISGVIKSIKWRDIAGMYELPCNLILTDYIILLFVLDKNGRKLLSKVLKSFFFN